MKIVLSNSAELTVSSVFIQQENQLCIGFTGIPDYAAFRASLTPDILATMKHYTDETNFTVYEGFTELTPTSKVTVTPDGKLDIAAFFNRPDKLTQKIRELETNITSIEAENKTLKETFEKFASSKPED
jgi:hypothetical protein